MNPIRYTSIVIAVAAALLSGSPVRADAQATITITGCASLTLVNGTTFACNGTPSNPSGPTGCSAYPQTTSVPASGGPVTISAACAGGAAVSSVTWTKNGAAFSGVFPDVLPANTGSSPVTYTYNATFNWSGTPAVTASATATVASNTSPPPPTPTPTGTIACTGYNVRTVEYSIPESGNQDFTAPMNPGEVVVGRFRTPSVPDTQFNLGYMYNAGASIVRTFTLSKDACDFGAAGANTVVSDVGKSVMWTVSVGPGQAIQLLPDTTYHFIVRGEVGGVATCNANTSCGGFFQVQNP